MAFSGNPLIAGKQSGPAAEERIANLLSRNSSELRILPLCDAKPLVAAFEQGNWLLAWQSPAAAKQILGPEIGKQLIYVGENENTCFCAAVSPNPEDAQGFESSEGGKMGFVDLRTLMVAAEWANESTMGELSIAGHARALLQWHSQVRFCGRCGSVTELYDAGQRRKCTNSACRTKHYPRIDPVVIMLVIDKENDRALLAHQPKYVPRMWSCLAGFLEPGESLEEAVRRETREETAVEVGEIVYHSSQPWPVGPNNMSCQLMMGFYAVAKSLDVRVDKKELEDARWYSREDVQKALSTADYELVQQETGLKVFQVCSMPDSKETGRGGSPLSSVARGEGIFVPGPYAIAHHLISTWACKGSSVLVSSRI